MAVSLSGKTASQRFPQRCPHLLPIVLASFETWRFSHQTVRMPMLIVLRVEEAWMKPKARDEQKGVEEDAPHNELLHVTLSIVFNLST